MNKDKIIDAIVSEVYLEEEKVILDKEFIKARIEWMEWMSWNFNEAKKYEWLPMDVKEGFQEIEEYFYESAKDLKTKIINLSLEVKLEETNFNYNWITEIMQRPINKLPDPSETILSNVKRQVGVYLWQIAATIMNLDDLAESRDFLKSTLPIDKNGKYNAVDSLALRSVHRFISNSYVEF